MKVRGDWFWREQIEVMLEETTRTGLNDFSLIDKLYIYIYIYVKLYSLPRKLYYTEERVIRDIALFMSSVV